MYLTWKYIHIFFWCFRERGSNPGSGGESAEAQPRLPSEPPGNVFLRVLYVTNKIHVLLHLLPRHFLRAYYVPGTRSILVQKQRLGRLSSQPLDRVHAVSTGHLLSNPAGSQLGTLCPALHLPRSGTFNPVFSRRVGEESISMCCLKPQADHYIITQIYHRTNRILSLETGKENTTPFQPV